MWVAPTQIPPVFSASRSFFRLFAINFSSPKRFFEVPYRYFYKFISMISEKDLQEFESLDLYEKISRIEQRLEGKENPKPFELGMLLALKMAVEIREQKSLGSESAVLVARWADLYPESVVEEAISNAKEFLLHSTSLVEKIRESLIGDDPKEDSGAK